MSGGYYQATWELSVEPSFTAGRYHWSATRVTTSPFDRNGVRELFAEGDEDSRAVAFAAAAAHMSRMEEPI